MDKTTRSLVDTIRLITEAGYDENGNWISDSRTKEARYGIDIPYPHGHPFRPKPTKPKGDADGIRAPHPWEQGAALPGGRRRINPWVLPSEDDTVYAGAPRPRLEIPNDLTTGPQFPKPPVTRGDYMPDGIHTPPLKDSPINVIKKNPKDLSHIKHSGPKDFPGEEGGSGSVNLPKNPKKPGPFAAAALFEGPHKNIDPGIWKKVDPERNIDPGFTKKVGPERNIDPGFTKIVPSDAGPYNPHSSHNNDIHQEPFKHQTTPSLKYIPDLKPKTPEEKSKQVYDSQRVHRFLKPGQESQAETLPMNTIKKPERFYSESVNRSVNTLKTLLTEITDRPV